MQRTPLAHSGASWLTAAMCALFMVAQAAGCKPEFTDDTCKTDQDCFINEICGPAGTCVKQAPETPEPTISTFESDKATITAGESITLSWTMSEAQGATITSSAGFSYTVPGAQLAQGSTTLTPEQTATYTLTARNGDESATRELTVTVEDVEPQRPAITSFTVSPMMVDAGGMVTLSWQTSGATSGQISGGAAPYDIPEAELGSGSVEVSVDEPTMFKLTVTNEAGSEEASVSVGVNGVAPSIIAFTITPQALVAGDIAELAWETAGAASISITDDDGATLDLIGQSPAMGKIRVDPAQDATYTLTATNAFGSLMQTVDVTVEPRISIISFSAAPATADPGEPVTLSWEILGGATSVTIQDEAGRDVPLGGADLAAGSVLTIPQETTIYTLTATKGAQQVSSSAAVTVRPAAPIITSFTSDLAQIAPGGSATLSWQTVDAVTIALSDAQGNMVDLTGKNPTMDSVTVSPAATTTYTLMAINAGGMVSRDLTITVGAPVSITSFTASPMGVLAGGDVTLSWDVANATGLTISASDGSTVDITGKSLTQDSITLQPATGMITYTLTAAGFNGPATATASVTVSEGVAITSFTASPNPVTAGQTVTLSWATTGATSLALDAIDSLGTSPYDISLQDVDADTFDVTVNRTTTFRLKAQGALGSMATMDVVVNIYVPVEITSFSASPASITAGQPVTLSWQTAAATSLSIVDQGGQQVTLPAGANLSNGSVTVTPSATTTYTLIAQGDQSSMDSELVTVTVAPAPLLITEIMLNPGGAGADDGREWVEIYNPGDTFVDLANYSMGTGGTNYLYAKIQLVGVLPPRGCAVIGGPTADAENGSPPAFFQAIDWNAAKATPGSGGGIQNGTNPGDGVALFAVTAANLTATTAPMDAIVFGVNNSSNLLGEDGQPKTELSPAGVAGGSIERVSATSDVFRATTAPTPGRCVTVDQVQGTVRAPNESSGTLRFTAFAFDPALMDVALGAQALTCTMSAPGAYECPLTAPGAGVTGAQALTITQRSEYTAGAGGAPVVTPLATPRATTRASAFLWEGRLDDTSGDFFCGLYAPGAPTQPAGSAISVAGEIYVAGVTNMGAGTLPAGWVVEGAAIPRGQTPYERFGQAWTTSVQTGTFGGPFGSNVIYTTTFMSSTAQQAEAAMRVSPDGISYYYCDLSSAGGSDDGWTAGGGAQIEWQ